MGYVIVGGIGLAVGLGLMIWALRERAARQKAEIAVLRAHQKYEEAAEIARKNAMTAAEMSEERRRIEDELAHVRGRLNELRQRLVECRDPQAIREWLDAETRAEEL